MVCLGQFFHTYNIGIKDSFPGPMTICLVFRFTFFYSPPSVTKNSVATHMFRKACQHKHTHSCMAFVDKGREGHLDLSLDGLHLLLSSGPFWSNSLPCCRTYPAQHENRGSRSAISSDSKSAKSTRWGFKGDNQNPVETTRGSGE